MNVHNDSVVAKALKLKFFYCRPELTMVLQPTQVKALQKYCAETYVDRPTNPDRFLYDIYTIPEFLKIFDKRIVLTMMPTVWLKDNMRQKFEELHEFWQGVKEYYTDEEPLLLSLHKLSYSEMEKEEDAE